MGNRKFFIIIFLISIKMKEFMFDYEFEYSGKWISVSDAKMQWNLAVPLITLKMATFWNFCFRRKLWTIVYYKVLEKTESDIPLMNMYKIQVFCSSLHNSHRLRFPISMYFQFIMEISIGKFHMSHVK